MLDFLDSFCRALVARDQLGIRRQLRHPLARALPPSVRSEAAAIARGGRLGRLAPTRTLHFYYQTLQLLASPGHLQVKSAPLEYAAPHPQTADLAASC